MYRISNLTKTGPVRLTGHMLPAKSVELDSPLDLTKEDYNKYHASIDALVKAGRISVAKITPSDGNITETGENARKDVDPGKDAEKDQNSRENQSSGSGVEADSGDQSPADTNLPASNGEPVESMSRDDLMAMKVSDLTPIATAMGIDTTGLRKEALVQAILDKNESK